MLGLGGLKVESTKRETYINYNMYIYIYLQERKARTGGVGCRHLAFVSIFIFERFVCWGCSELGSLALIPQPYLVIE